ncbi:hypothetical protein [Larkinella sp.]|uniref:hypothetical protein n=1 Tax=Larkinella sp. TaxID=2034517 RepID=UPI003BAD16E4
MLDIYKPDRLDWMYCTNESQLTELRKRNIKFSLAINPQIPDSGEYTVNGRIKDIEGNKLKAPWMQNWEQKNPYWGCVNNPIFQKLFIKKTHQIIDLGAYGVFVDDSRLNEQAIDWGGCMCEFCIPGFTKYMHENYPGKVETDFDYRNFLMENGIKKESFIKKINIPFWSEYKDYQENSVIRFLERWKKDAKIYSANKIVFLTNNYKGKWSNIYKQFEVGIAEVPANGLKQKFIVDGIEQARQLNKKQFYTFSSDSDADNVEAVLDMYLLGTTLVIPWDVYVDLKSRKKPTRYYGEPDIYSPIYNAIRENTVIETVNKKNNYNFSQTKSETSSARIGSKENKIASSKIVKYEFQDSTNINTVLVEKEIFKIIYPKNKSKITVDSQSQTRINVYGKLLVIKYEN